MTGVGFTLFWATHFPIHNWGISFSVCNFICLSLCFTAAVLKCYLLLNCARAHNTCIFVNWNWSKNLRSLPHINRRHTCFTCSIGSCSSFFILFSFDVVFFFYRAQSQKTCSGCTISTTTLRGE